MAEAFLPSVPSAALICTSSSVSVLSAAICVSFRGVERTSTERFRNLQSIRTLKQRSKDFIQRFGGGGGGGVNLVMNQTLTLFTQA